jgi:hypothetical protein
MAGSYSINTVVVRLYNPNDWVRITETRRCSLTNSSESPSVQNCEQFKIANNSESRTVQNCEQFRIANSSESRTIQNREQFKIANDFFSYLCTGCVTTFNTGNFKGIMYHETLILSICHTYYSTSSSR